MRYFLGEYYISDGCKPIDVKVKKPIEWMALKNTIDGKTLLLSKNVIDWDFYHEEDIPPWKDTWLYECLKELYRDCFSAEEKDAIIGGEWGQIFILSEDEIVKYLPDDESRRSISYFVYRNENGEIETSIEHFTYWLRAKENTDIYSAPFITSTGEIAYGNGEADEIGIRPAIWVDTKKARMLTAQKGFNKWHHFWDCADF